MKYHPSKELAFERADLPVSMRTAFYAGWYACGNAILSGTLPGCPYTEEII